ncbi:MAG TPA: EAL domain-containing protein [Burkholderiaceae bacterium]|nr:EAL domain-containing protein [Burkholderiaceae bacterium]
MATILIVDDRPSNRQFLLTLLGYAGHELLEAADGAEALRLIRRARPDLVITDILMPTMDGCEMVSRIRADPNLAATPVIFYSATYSETQARKLAASCGVDEVLPKPSDPDRVLAAVNRALHSGAGAESIDRAESPSLETTHIGRADGAIATSRRDPQGVKAEFNAIAERAAVGLLEPDRVGDPSKGFSEDVSRLQRVTSRLSALIEVGFALNLERDPERLVNLFFAAACNAIDSKFAAVAMLNPEESALHHVVTRGVDAEIFRKVRDVYGGPLGSLLAQHRTIRGRLADFGAAALIVGHLPIDNILAVSIASPDRIYGWIYFADRIGAAEFSQEDELLAQIMATELALRYEHTMLFDVIQEHAASLQLEVTQRRRAQEALVESEGRFRQLAENIQEVFWLTDTSKNEMLYVSPAYEAIWGRSVVGIYQRPQDWLEAIHPDDRGRVLEAAVTKQVRGDYDEEYRIVRPDGSIRWIRDRAFPVREMSGEVVRLAGVAEDITDRKREAQKLQRLTRMYAVLSGINGAIVRVSNREDLFRECCRIVVEAGRFKLACVRLIDPLDRRLKIAAMAGADEPGATGLSRPPMIDERLEGGSPAAIALRDRRAIVVNDVNPDSSIDQRAPYLEHGVRSMASLPLLVAAEPVGTLDLHSTEPGYFDQEEVQLLLELAGDMSFALEHIGRAETIEYLALYDSLTGLANRTLFLDRLGQRLHHAGQAGEKIAVVLAGIERLRTINESLGRRAGDAVLREVAGRLARGAAREDLARVGADQFAIVLEAAKEESDVARRIERIFRECVGEPFTVEGSDLRVAAKAGVALYPKDGTAPEALLRGAEAALLRSKETGQRHVFHVAEMTAMSAEKLSLENSLQRALEKDEFVLHYQTKLDLDTRRIAGVEALIRWQSPDQGLVLPGRFIRLLEETGLILEVGTQALRRAAQDHRRYSRQGIVLPRIAVNVSSIQFGQPDFVDVVKEVISEEDPPTPLDLEITESIVMEDVARNVDKLKALRDLGVKIAIDDFGTGYSSLAYLTKLPVDSLKIDRSFIAGMLDDPDTMTLVATIISLAHSLRLTVVAEGVETEEQARMLRVLRCDQAQGYLFSRPVPLEELAQLIRVTG